MRSLLDVINESLSYKVYHDNMNNPVDKPYNMYIAGEHVSDQGNKETEEFLVNLVNKLNDVKMPITNKNYTVEYGWCLPGVFTFKVGEMEMYKRKVPRQGSAAYLQTAKYNGIVADIDSGWSRDAIDEELSKAAIRAVFGCDVSEAINDDDKIFDDHKELMNLVKYYTSIRDILKSTFKTNKFTRIPGMGYTYFPFNSDLDIDKARSSLSKYGGLPKYPEFKYKHIYVRLYAFDIDSVGSIKLRILFYEDR